MAGDIQDRRVRVQSKSLLPGRHLVLLQALHFSGCVLPQCSSKLLRASQDEMLEDQVMAAFPIE